MKKSKKIALLLAGILILSAGFTGCSDEDYEETDGEAQEYDYSEQDGDMELLEEEGELDENPNRSIRRGVSQAKFIPGTMLDGTPLTEDYYYYRATLSDIEKQAYDTIRDGLLKGSKKIYMTVPIPKAEIGQIYWKVLNDSPEIVWTTMGLKYNYNNQDVITAVIPKYNEMLSDIEGTKAQMENSAKSALAEMWSLPSQVEKVKYAHDYLSHTVNYTKGAPHNQNAYSAIVNKKTVCAGYARSLQYLLQKVGVPCTYLSSKSHAWNLLKIDGDYYSMDVTWDDPTGQDPDKYRYKYFNLSDDIMGKDHKRDAASAELPVAYGTAANFQNAFGGNQYGTKFGNISAELPDTQPVQTEEAPQDIFGGAEWWNALDETWKESDWTPAGEAIWKHYDAEYGVTYYWDANVQQYYSQDDGYDERYMLDFETGEWVELSPDDEYQPDIQDDGNNNPAPETTAKPAENTEPAGNSADGWWSYLDESLKKSDWHDEGNGEWTYNQDGVTYYWVEEDETFYAVDDETGENSYLDMNTDEWIAIEE